MPEVGYHVLKVALIRFEQMELFIHAAHCVTRNGKPVQKGDDHEKTC